MAYIHEEIARTLKAGRLAKGLSQRALGAKAGMTQAQISMTEHGTVDLRLSSLMELARVLDLELMLVPRKAVSAAQALLRSIATEAPEPAAAKALRSLTTAVERMRAQLPSKSLSSLAHAARALEGTRLNASAVREIQKLTQTARRISRSLEHTKTPKISKEQAERINQIMLSLRQIGNSILHAVPPSSEESPRPAYTLDDDGDSGA